MYLLIVTIQVYLMILWRPGDADPDTFRVSTLGRTIQGMFSVTSRLNRTDFTSTFSAGLSAWLC